MFKFVVLLAVLSSIAWGAPQSEQVVPLSDSDVPLLDGRIVGGQSTNIANYPYQVSLQRSNSHICGGGLISLQWVLTAAHCVVGGTVSSFSIRGGSSTRNSGGQVIAASRVLIHASFVSNTLDYDISVIQLTSSFSVSNTARINLANAGGAPTAGLTATLTGWGATSEGGSAATTLQVVTVPVVSQSSCRSSYGSSSITDRMFCAGLAAGGRDACQGDSGGPVVISGVLTGIVSWGTGCARPNYPGVYASVPPLRNWISSATGI